MTESVKRPILSLKNLRKTYNGGFEALKGIDLEVEEGDFFALLGQNGAGKSTTLGIVSGLVTKTSGQVSVAGYDIDSDFFKAKQHLGIVPQEVNLNGFETCLNVLLIQAGLFGVPSKVARERAEFLLEALGLSQKRDEHTIRLSGGMKRRLMIARALVHQPKLLLLDEPTAGVDVELRRHMWDFIQSVNEAGTTIILTTHYLEEVEKMARHVAIIHGGTIAAHAGTRDLLGEMPERNFLFEMATPFKEAPHLSLEGVSAECTEEGHLRIQVPRSTSLSTVISALEVDVVDVRELESRIEQVFLSKTST